MLAQLDAENDDAMTLQELGLAGIFDDEALANEHEVKRAPCTSPIHASANVYAARHARDS